jgi:hypothetical protein
LASFLMLMSAPGRADATIYYIGQFSGSSPVDASDCGLGRGSTTNDRPCASLAYWTQNRRGVLLPGDTVRIAPGVYQQAGSQTNCIMAAPGVTYEGRSATDTALDNFTSVRIDLANCNPTGDINSTCNCNGVNGYRGGGSLSGFTVRDLKIQNAPTAGTSGSAGIRINVGRITDGLTIDRVWIENVGRQGMIFQEPSQTDVDCNGSRLLRNLTIVDSRVNGARGVFGGIAIGCVDGFIVARNLVHDNYDASSYDDCLAGASGCNDHDGIQMAGAINGSVSRNHVHHCGEDCIDVGGHHRKTYNVVIEANDVHDGASRFAKASGGAGPNIVFRNNYFYGGAGPIEVGACAFGIKWHNNTIWKTNEGMAVKLWSACQDCQFRNNIIRGVPSAAGQVVMVSRGSTVSNGGVDIVWENNVVIASGPGRAIGEDLGSGTCEEDGCICGGLCSKPAWCPAPWPAEQDTPDLLPNELARFRSEGDTGRWFGPESGDTDVWGQVPAVVRPASPSAANLHLGASDTAARNRGQTISGFGQDYDGQARLSPWDIGADEFQAACVTNADCDDAIICTADRCIDGNCSSTDTCSVGFHCSTTMGTCQADSPPTTVPPNPLAAPRLLSVEPVP